LGGNKSASFSNEALEIQSLFDERGSLFGSAGARFGQEIMPSVPGQMESWNFNPM